MISYETTHLHNVSDYVSCIMFSVNIDNYFIKCFQLQTWFIKFEVAICWMRKRWCITPFLKAIKYCLTKQTDVLSYLLCTFHQYYQINCTLVESLWCRHKCYGIMLNNVANCSSITKTTFLYDGLRASISKRNKKEIIYHIQNWTIFIWWCT